MSSTEIDTGNAHTTWSEFNRFWVSQSFAQVAGQILYYAFPLIAATFLKLSAAEVAGTTALQFIPTLVVTPLAGIIVDRVNRARLVLTCHAVRGALLAATGILGAAGQLNTSLFWTVVFVAGALNALASVGTLAIVPDLAPRDGLAKANGRLQLTMSLSQVSGPAVAGVLVGFSGSLVLWSIAVAFGIAAVLIVRTRTMDAPPSTVTATSWFKNFIAGAQFVRKVRILWVILIQMTLFNFFEQAVITLFMLFALRELGFSSTLVGLILGAGAIGSFVGASVAAKFPGGQRALVVLVCSMGLASVAPCAIPFVPSHAGWTSIAMCALAFGSYGFGLTVFNVHSNTIRHELGPRNLQGRLASVFRTTAFTAISLGAAFAGLLAERMSFRAALVVACVGLVSAFVLFATLMVTSGRSQATQSTTDHS